MSNVSKSAGFSQPLAEWRKDEILTVVEEHGGTEALLQIIRDAMAAAEGGEPVRVGTVQYLEALGLLDIDIQRIRTIDAKGASDRDLRAVVVQLLGPDVELPTVFDLQRGVNTLPTSIETYELAKASSVPGWLVSSLLP